MLLLLLNGHPPISDFPFAGGPLVFGITPIVFRPRAGQGRPERRGGGEEGRRRGGHEEEKDEEDMTLFFL